jgi:hypothetical protein
LCFLLTDVTESIIPMSSVGYFQIQAHIRS